ncbi:FkbM family methyltransferase [uncultured Prochlorococcus sp.]|uniref:FkbM family methyltransferase n=1 Tax=uncultured Prochlorococcus sp. TaxID=159733 RepID=UPI0025876340|nr:FkbM family methyltransferase [uncultured Prochlorococcus sp.]
MALSKIKNLKIYQLIRKIWINSLLRKLNMILNPWHVFYKVRKLEKEISFLKGKYENDFLKDAKGVIHVGGNLGQERFIYDYFMLKVIWFEPIPKIYKKLKENLEEFPNQISYEKLITNKDGEKYDFYIADNYASSSIFKFHLHKSLWPSITQDKKISLKSITLDSFFDENNIDDFEYDTLIMDTQGSELLVLKGSQKILKNFKYVKTEVSDFESYRGGFQLKDIDNFMKQNDFKPFIKSCFKRHEAGNYYDILYKKI